MVVVVKKEQGSNTYYFLRHNTGKLHRIGRSVQKEMYLGKTIPEDIENVKKNFLLSIYRDIWRPELLRIRKGFTSDVMNQGIEKVQSYYDDFAILFTYNSQKIEGSTLTKKGLTNLIHKGITPYNKLERDMIEAKLHHQCFIDSLKVNSISIKLISDWHKKIFYQTKPEVAGNLRKTVLVTSFASSESEYPKPKMINKLLKAIFKWYDTSKGKISPVELAATMHLKIISLQPFTDGNGMIARLVMNQILDRYGYPMINIDYSIRKFYFWSIQRSQKEDNDIHFLQWFMKRYFDNHQAFLEKGLANE